MLNEKELKDKLETIKKVFEEDEDLLQDGAVLKESVELEFSEIAEAIEEIVECKVRKAMESLTEEIGDSIKESIETSIMGKVTEAFELVTEKIESLESVGQEPILQKVSEAFEVICDRIENDNIEDGLEEDIQLVEKQDFSEYIDYRLGFLKESVSYNKLEQIKDLLNENEFGSEDEIQKFFDALEEDVRGQKYNTLNEERQDDFVSACSSMLK